LRAVSTLIALLIAIAVSVATGVLAFLVVTGVLGVFGALTTLTVAGGSAFIDPSDGFTVVGEVQVSVVGSGRVTVEGVRAIYGGVEYRAVCLNCETVFGEGFPRGGCDTVSLKFYFKPRVRPVVGDKLTVIVEYSTGGRVCYASGTVTIVE